MTKTIIKSTRAPLALGLTLSAAMPAMAATDGSAGATSTGSFDVLMDVTATPSPTVQIHGLDDVNFGTVDASQLTSEASAPGDYVCAITTNLPLVSGAYAAVNISFHQDNVTFNSDIGTRFALVGPSREGTASGVAQVPMQLEFSGVGGG